MSCKATSPVRPAVRPPVHPSFSSVSQFVNNERPSEHPVVRLFAFSSVRILFIRSLSFIPSSLVSVSLHVIARSLTRPPVCLYVRSPVAPPVRTSISLSAHRPCVRPPVLRPVRSPVLVRPPCYRRSFLPTVRTFFLPSDRGLSARSCVSLSNSTSARPSFRKTANPSVCSSAHHPSLYIRLLTRLASFLPIRPCVGPSVYPTV